VHRQRTERQRRGEGGGGASTDAAVGAVGEGSGRGVATSFVARMRAHVPRDHVTSTRGVGTLRTPVRLLAGVGPLVSGEVVRARENLTAHATSVGLDAGVQTHVPGEHVAARK